MNNPVLHSVMRTPAPCAAPSPKIRSTVNSVNRYRLLDPPHKGIRNLLGMWSLASGSTDVRDTAELEALKQFTARVVALLEDHAHNEEAWVFPLLEARAPGTVAALHHEHERLDAQLRVVRDTISALTDASDSEAVLAAHLAVTEFQARYLLHLIEEDTEFEPRLWALYSDEELMAAEAAVAVDLDPALLLQWFEICAPARTIAEDIDVLRNVRAVLPPEAFSAVLAAIERTMPSQRFESIIQRLG